MLMPDTPPQLLLFMSRSSLTPCWPAILGALVAPLQPADDRKQTIGGGTRVLRLVLGNFSPASDSGRYFRWCVLLVGGIFTGPRCAIQFIFAQITVPLSPKPPIPLAMGSR